VLAGAIWANLTLASVGYAQQPPTPPPPQPAYGPAVTTDQAKRAVAAALAEAKKSPYLYVFAVVEPSGSLVYFERMDGAALYAANESAIRKARTAALFKRPTADFFNLMESGHSFVATVTPELSASIGGVPLVVDGKIIGGIGVAGSPSGPIDLAPAEAGANALK
jgi:uncharacterized protein GlcG (DUF336 family)